MHMLLSARSVWLFCQYYRKYKRVFLYFLLRFWTSQVAAMLVRSLITIFVDCFRFHWAVRHECRTNARWTNAPQINRCSLDTFSPGQLLQGQMHPGQILTGTNAHPEKCSPKMFCKRTFARSPPPPSPPLPSFVDSTDRHINIHMFYKCHRHQLSLSLSSWVQSPVHHNIWSLPEHSHLSITTSDLFPISVTCPPQLLISSQF